MSVALQVQETRFNFQGSHGHFSPNLAFDSSHRWRCTRAVYSEARINMSSSSSALKDLQHRRKVWHFLHGWICGLTQRTFIKMCWTASTPQLKHSNLNRYTQTLRVGDSAKLNHRNDLPRTKFMSIGHQSACYFIATATAQPLASRES